MTDENTQVSKDIWGPSLWSAMHSLAFTYPVACENDCDKRDGMYMFLTSLTKVIPCKECRDHYIDWYNIHVNNGKNSEIFNSRDKLSKEIFNLHNEVDIRTGKQTLTFEEVRSRYVTSQSKCSGKLYNNRNSIVLISTLVVIAVIAAGLAYNKHKNS